MKGIQPSLLVRVQGPKSHCVREKGDQHAGLVHPHLSAECHYGVVSHPLCQRGHGSGCFAYQHVELRVSVPTVALGWHDEIFCYGNSVTLWYIFPRGGGGGGD